jgi:UTP--glucose-1-phosphate uridylyltransferase
MVRPQSPTATSAERGPALEPVRVAVIPAAGLGTRFLPVTKTVPKEMLPLVDTPILDAVISEAVAAGVEEVVVVSAPGKRALEAYFEPAPLLERRLAAEGRTADLDLARRGQTLTRVRIVYQEEPLGNGHAVLQAREAVGERPFLMIWGDDVTKAEPAVAAQLVATRERMGGGSVAAVMNVSEAEARRYGVIRGEALDDRTWRVEEIVEKPSQEQLAGLARTASGEVPAAVHACLLEPGIFSVLERLQPGKGNEIWLTDALNEIAKRQPLYAYRFEGERFDAGDRAGYIRAVVAAALDRPELARELYPWLRARLDNHPPV